jgi:ATP-binding cassette, subfamily B, bacterial PglK
MQDSDQLVIKYIVAALSKNVFITITAIAFLLAILDVAGILLIYPYVSVVLDAESYKKYSFLYSDLVFLDQKTFVLLLSFLLAVFYLLKAYINNLLISKQNKITAEFTKEMTDSFLKKLLNAKYEVFNHLSASRLAGVAFSNTVHASLVLQAIVTVVCELLFLSILFIVFLINTPVFGAGIILTTLMYFLIVYRPLGKKVATLGIAQNEIENARHRVLHSIVASIRDIKIMGLSTVFEKKSNYISEEFSEINWKYSTYQGLTKVTLETLIFLGLIVLIQVLVLGDFAIKEVAPFIGVIVISTLRTLPSVAKLLMAMNSYRYSKSFVEKLIHIERSLSQSQQEKIQDKLTFNNILKIEGLSFKYGEHRVLNQINININKGQSIGIVGPSGSGKSTLLDIITGLLESQSGNFNLDGHKFVPFLSSSLHDMLGYVPQSISLLDESIAYNISFEHKPDLSKLKNAIKMSNLESLISSLPDKEATKLGEGGITLSGGQRQRVGIARALYKTPEILIFDEATSALDALSEKALSEEISKLKGQLTTVIVAHKLTNVINCENIYVLDKGNIIASGSHNDLIKSCELYKHMYDLQQVVE